MYSPQPEIRNCDVVGSVLENTRRSPDSPAFFLGPEPLSYGKLELVLLSYARQLRRRGVTRDSTIALFMKDPFVVPALVLATGLIGCRWLQGSAEIFASESIGVTHALFIPKNGEQIPKEATLVDHSWLPRPGDANRLKEIPFDGFASQDSVWRIGQSSGTTGSRKAMNLTCRDIYLRCRRLNIREGAHVFSFFPPSSGVGSNVTLATLMGGGAVVLGPRDKVLVQSNVTDTFGSPAQYSSLMKVMSRPAAPLKATAYVGGGKASRELIESLFGYFSDIKLSFGSTEAGRVASRKLDRGSPIPEGLIVDPDVEVEIVDETGIPLPPESEGMVRIRTKSQTATYVEAPEATETAFRDSWFYPGDRGYFTREGALVVVGRANDQFNLGGPKIAAGRIDDVIQGVREVIDGIGFTEPDEQGIEGVAVIAKIGPIADRVRVASSLRDTVVRQLGPAATPRAIYFADEVPRTGNDKPAREAARSLAQNLKPY